MDNSQDISQNRPLLWLMAIACGLCAGVNYYCQPLVHSIQQYFAVTEAQAALTVTFAQVSYALGLLFIVPLGIFSIKADLFLYSCFCCYWSASLWFCYQPAYALGWHCYSRSVFSCCSGTHSTGYHGGSTGKDRRGRWFLMSGLLIGILLSTSLAGVLSNLFEWNIIYLASAVMMLCLAYLLKVGCLMSCVSRWAICKSLVRWPA